jgi:hypothetical protein
VNLQIAPRCFVDGDKADYAFGSNPPYALPLFNNVTTKTAIVPANAGTHDHSRFW